MTARGEHNHEGAVSMACATCINDNYAAVIRRARAVVISGLDLDEAVRGYLEALLWTTPDGIWQTVEECEILGASVSDVASLPNEQRRYHDDLMAQWDEIEARIPDDEISYHGENLDEFYDIDDIDGAYVASVRAEIEDFASMHPLAVRMYLAQTGGTERGVHWQASSLFGHDFLLTRDHHGVGFWDRGLGELGDYLTSKCQAWGSSNELFDGRLAVEAYRTTEATLLGSDPV